AYITLSSGVADSRRLRLLMAPMKDEFSPERTWSGHKPEESRRGPQRLAASSDRLRDLVLGLSDPRVAHEQVRPVKGVHEAMAARQLLPSEHRQPGPEVVEQ